MFEITVNNRIVDAQEGETILAALQRVGIHVPTLCYLEALPPAGACRICVVEVEGMKELVPSCSCPVQEGMRILTHSEKVIRARKTILELLLSNHPDDCLYCIRNGNCELQKLAAEYGIRGRNYDFAAKNTSVRDQSSPAIVRDSAKCILCGKCVRTCQDIQKISAIDFVGRGADTVISPVFLQSLNVSACINCGQCVLVCPTGALRERSHAQEVMDALNDSSRKAFIQIAPATAIAIGEEFGFKPGCDLTGLLCAALRRIGFDKVFDTSFAADLTVMEEAHELMRRLETPDDISAPLPMFTSCSPAWIKYVEEFHPEYIPNLSTCKSPQMMLGAILKHVYAKKENLNPESVYSVSAMPCTAKKFEATRPEMSRNGQFDIDAVLSTRELARIIRMHGIDFDFITPEQPDFPFGIHSTAGRLFGASGGVMEATLRTVHKIMTGKELKTMKIEQVRGMDGIKEARLKIGGKDLSVAVVNGIGNAAKLLEQLKGGRNDLRFIEVMSCPGGCIGGGGQPLGADPRKLIQRMQSLYGIDQSESLRTAHDNPAVKELYRELSDSPGGETARALLHTVYTPRNVIR